MQPETNALQEQFAKLNERLTGMGKFISEGNQRIMETMLEGNQRITDTVLERMPVKQRPKEPMMSPTIAHLNKALRDARKNFKEPQKNGSGHKGKYSTYDDLVTATLPALDAAGLAVIFMPEANEFNEPALTMVISHDSGEWIRSTMALREYEATQIKDYHQKVGSAMTYLTRYMYKAGLSIAGEFEE